MKDIKINKKFFNEILILIQQAREKVAFTINEEMIILYWKIGEIIRKNILKSKRAIYGEQILQSLIAKLVPIFGKGFSQRNLWYMKEIGGTVLDNLT